MKPNICIRLLLHRLLSTPTLMNATRLSSRILTCGCAVTLLQATPTIGVAQAGLAEWQAAVSADNPRNWYRFDETSGTTLVDYGPGGLDGEYLGVGVNQTGLFGPGQAANFPGQPAGDDRVVFAANWAEQTISGDWTAEFIVNKASAGVGIPQALLNGPATSVRLEQWNSFALFGDYRGGVTQYGVADWYLEGTVVAPDEWSHMVFVRSGGQTFIYLNGVQRGSMPNVVDLEMETISRPSVEEVDKLHALLDEVVVYDRALSALQIATHFATTGITPREVAPTIATQPQSQAVLIGTPDAEVTFSVVATGTLPLEYQWFKDDEPIPGANSNSHTLTSTSAEDAGTYYVTVSNAAGSVTSDTATLFIGSGLPLHVDAGAVGDNSGSSWENAFTDLQAALDAAFTATGVPVEIRVAAGTYRPSMLSDPFSSDSRRATFQLLNNVALYGGFPPGGGEWETRDVTLHETILSGDIGVPGDDSDNCYSVVRGDGTDATAILDGFTIREGRAVEWHWGMDDFITIGGGMLIREGSPTIATCTFTDNFADHGAALYVHTSGSPRLSDCLFVQNTAIRGGGAVVAHLASPVFQRCVFNANRAGANGGAAIFSGDTAVLEGCVISGNAALQTIGEGYGGGVGRGTLINCVLTGNSGTYGGGTWRSTLYNCTLVGNAAAVRGGGADSSELYNCIVYGNSAPSGQEQYDSTLDHCWTSDPRFLDSVAGDLHLQFDSPCINAGQNGHVKSAIDLDGNPRIDQGTVDIGAYERAPDPNAIALRPAQNSLQATESMTVEVILPEGANDSEPVTVQVVNQTPAVVSLTGAVDNLVTLQYPAGGPRVQQLSVTGIAAGEARLSASAGGYTDGAATFGVWTPAPPLHVDAGATGDNSGSSWENAFTDLQDALDEASVANSVPVEIRVASGTYRPSSLSDPFSSDSRRATFQLLNGVALYGGFPPGGGEWESRDVALHETILSGDIGVGGDDSDNCYSVVRGDGTDATAILDGFTIREGRAVEWHWGMDAFITFGGGMLIREGSPTVANCTFTDNFADHGAALYVHTSGSPRLSDCLFVQNTAIRGGGAVVAHLASPVFQRCVFNANRAGANGGAAIFSGDTAVLEGCVISGNAALQTIGEGYGGGVGRGTLINCVLTGNSGTYGGGTWRSTLYNCTLVGNAAARRGGGADSSELYNCIVYGNSAPSGQEHYGSTLDHCWTSDPRFVDYVAGDLHLRSDSPCINAGENAYATSATDLDGNPRIDEGTVDIGAYERAPEPPAIARQPGHWALKEGGPGRIALAVSGHPTPQIQWYFNGTPVPDGNDTFLEFPTVTRDLEGLYWMVASNALGEITSDAIVLLVSNVEPVRFPAWEWTSDGGTVTVEMAPTPFGPWVEGGLLPAGTTSGLYVETDFAEPTSFYRLQGDANARFTATGRIPGWWYPEAEGAVHVIEYAWSGNGWGNWVELTELTLPASPHLFLDTEAFDRPGAVYRSTPKAP